MLIIIGLGFVFYAVYSIFGTTPEAQEGKKQLYAMMAVGGLFILAGLSLKKR